VENIEQNKVYGDPKEQEMTSIEQVSNIITQESKLIKRKSESMEQVSKLITQESKIIQRKSRIMMQKSEIMEQKSESMNQEMTIMMSPQRENSLNNDWISMNYALILQIPL